MTSTIINTVFPLEGSVYGNTTLTMTGSGLNQITAVYLTTVCRCQSLPLTIAEQHDLSMTCVTPVLSLPLNDVSMGMYVKYIYTTTTSTTNTIVSDIVYMYKINPAYYGLYYVFNALGGFSVQEQFPEIPFTNVPPLHTFDLTDALQINFDVRKFNSLIGLIKDASNVQIVQSAFNTTTNQFPNNDISLNALDFINGIVDDSYIISLGSFSSIYSDFYFGINSYFSYGNEFTPDILDCINDVSLNQYTFGPAEFRRLLIPQSINTGGNVFVANITGNIVLNRINSILDSFVTKNTYNNRNQVGEPYFNPSNGLFYRVQDGFIDGDMIYIPNGITIKMDLQVVSAAPPPLTFPACIPDPNIDFNVDYGSGGFLTTTTISGNTIITAVSKTVTAPILLRLRNLTTNPYQYE